MKQTLTYIGILTVGVVVGIGIGIMFNFNKSRGLLNGATNSQSDTTAVTIYDTLQVALPEFVTSQPVGIEVYPIAQVPVLLYLSDTITKPYFVNNDLIIPRTQKYYKDPRYEAWVSGYNPRLDSLLIYQQTKTITIEKLKQHKAELSLIGQIDFYSSWAVLAGLEAELRFNSYGFAVGSGAVATPEGVKWYWKAGVKYTLFQKYW